MMETLSTRQQDLLKLLLENKAGLTVEELSQALQITRNAVRQHLAGMERDGLVVQSGTRPTAGRPEILYMLGEKGRELFPRQYSWLSELFIESIRKETGSEGLSKCMREMGARVAAQVRAPDAELDSEESKVGKLADLMTTMGYGARKTAQDGAPTIEANNCVFHHLADKYPEVCHFDLALMATFVDGEVEHQECMVRGGMVCRFKFK